MARRKPPKRHRFLLAVFSRYLPMRLSTLTVFALSSEAAEQWRRRYCEESGLPISLTRFVNN